MQEERRGSARVPIGEPCMLTIGDRQLRATIENLSDVGCLAHIADHGPNAVSDDDLGEEATFILSSMKPARQYTGEIIRRYVADGAHHLGLRFWKRYRELPGS